jgi:hypothetical protein
MQVPLASSFDWLFAEAALLADLAELLFRLGYQLFNASLRQIVQRLAGHRAVLDDLHFEFDTFVF